MKAFKFSLLTALIFSATFVFGQSTGDYLSTGTGSWTNLATWQRYNGTDWVTPTSLQGYPGQYVSQSYGVVTIEATHNVTADFPVATTVTADGLGTLSGRTTNTTIQKLVLKSGTAYGNGGVLTLPVSGSVLATYVKTQEVEIGDYGALNFGAKATFAIPADAILKVGQAAFIGSVTANNNIIVGSQWFAVGTSNKAQFNFNNLISAGGTLNSVMSSPLVGSVYCQNESIPLSGNFSGVYGTTTANGGTAGVNYIWYIDENYSTPLRTGILTSPNVDHTVFNYPATSLTPGIHTLKFYTNTYYTTTLYSNNEYRTVTILETPKLSGVSQPWAACRHNTTEIQLNGMIPNTTFTVNYTITGNTPATTTATSDATGKAVFNLAIGLVDHGKTLTVNSLSYTALGKTNTQTFSANNSTTLSVWRFDGFTWTGLVSNDWNNAANWCRGSFDETYTIPTALTDVYIPDKDSTQFSPVISTSNALVKNITIGNDGVLSFADDNKTLQVKGNWTNHGTLNANSGKILFSGAESQTIGGSVATSFYSLEINNNSGVIAEKDLTVLKLLTLTSDNIKTNPELVTADRGTLHTGTNILTMSDTAQTEGVSDVTGIVRRVNIQYHSREYTFGSRHTLLTFAESGTATYPTEIKVYISIGTVPSWKSNAILREYHFIQTGGSNCYATIRTSYKDSELNGIAESRLMQWTQFSSEGTPEGGHEWGRSNANSTNNWVEITNINIGLFPTEKGSTGSSLGANVTETLVWNGSVSTEWHNPANWTPNQSPSRLKNIIIPDAETTNYDPLVPLDDENYYGDITEAEVKTILLEQGSILNSDMIIFKKVEIPAFLNIYGSQGAWNNQGGTFNPNKGTVILHNDSTLFATVSGETQFYNIEIDPDVALYLTANSYIKIGGEVFKGTNAKISSLSAAANTIEYNGTGTSQDVIIPNDTNPRYHNLILSGSGTKIMPTVDLNILGDFTMTNSVTVNLPANSLNVYGDVVVNDGITFVASTSTINMAGSTSQSIGGTKTSLSLYNLTNSNTTDTVKINIPSLSLGGNLTNNGVLDFQTNTLNSISGTLANKGIIRTANTTASPLPTGKTWSVVSGENTFGTVEYCGVTAQTAVAGTYHNLTVANPTGLTAAENITMTGNLALNKNASTTKGSLDMGAYTLEMGLTGTTTGAGDVSGRVQRTKPQSGSFVKDVAYNFGNKNTFIKFLDVVSAKPDMLAVNIKLGTKPTYASTAMLNDYHAINRTYSFSTSGTATDRTLLQLAYLDSELQLNTDESDLSLWIAYQLEGVNTSFSCGHTEVNTTDNWMNITGLTPSQYAQAGREFGLANNKSFITWTGNGALAYKGDWSLPGNWDGGVPMANDSVVIPASAALLPDFKGWPSSNGLSSSIPAVAKSITIEENAILNGTGYNITLYGTGNVWINNGTFKADTLAVPSSLSKVIFANGSATPAVITGDSISAFQHLEIAENSSIQLESDTMLIAGNVTSGSGSVVDFNTNKTTVIYNGSKQTVINPTGGSGGYHNLILAGSSTKTLAADSPLQVKGNFTMSGTASTTPVQPLLVDTAFTIDAGATFNGGSRTHFVGGDFSVNGTFNPENSTINFNGEDDQHIKTAGSGPVVFNNIYIPVVSVGKKVIADKGIGINGSLVNQATLNMGQNDLSGTLSLINNNGTIETQSTSIAALPSSKIWEGTGYVLLNGVGGQQTLIDGTFNNIEINNATGVLQSGAVRINSDLKLTNGLLTTSSSYKLTIDCAATITGASANSYINGPLLREYCAADSLHFPIGKTGAYRPLSIKYTQLDAPSVVTAEQFESPLPGATYSGPEFGYVVGTTDILDTRFWRISQTGGTDYTYNVTLDGSNFSLSTTYDEPAIVKGIGSAYNTYTANTNVNLYTISSLKSFSDFTVGGTECAAPEITLHPVDDAAVAGKESASFSVTATGSGTLTYQWQVNTGSGFADIPDAKSSTLTIGSVTASMHNNTYRVIVTNDGCVNTATSNEAKLRVSVIWLGTTTDWNTVGNWFGNELPVSGSDIIFATAENNEVAAANNLVLDADRVIGSLQNESDKAIVIPTGIELLVNDTLPAGDLASKIHIKSAAGVANGTLRFAKPAKNTNVNATIEMYSKAEATIKSPLSNYKWQFFGIPLKYMPKADPVFYGSWVSRFVESASGTYWVSLNNNSPLFSWQGYEITHANPKTIIFSGSLETANFEKSLNYTESATYKGQHIFGNPYTTAIDISKIDFGAETEATVYLYNTGSRTDWNNGAGALGDNPGQYVAIPKNLLSATNPETGIVREIPSMQGFLVRKMNSGTNNLVNFTIAINYDSVAKKNLSPQRAPKQIEGLPYTIIDVKGTRYSDRVWLFTNSECSNNFDNGWDGQKYGVPTAAPLLYTFNGTKNYQIQTTNDINGTDLRFRKGEDTQYELIFNHYRQEETYSGGIYLEDLLTGVRTNITSNGSVYKFNSASTDPTTRFRIVTESDIETDNHNPNTTGAFSAYAYNKMLVVNNFTTEILTFALYDAMGRALYENKVMPGSRNQFNTGLPEGAYIVRCSNGESFKLILE